MEQTHEQFIHSTFDHLDTTAKEITAALTRGNCRHGFIGGYAVSLVGGMRMTDVRPFSVFSTLARSLKLI